MNETLSTEDLLRRIKELEEENAKLRNNALSLASKQPTVSVPEQFSEIFDSAQKTVGEYFNDVRFEPENGTIEIAGQRYLLVRAAALSRDFFKTVMALYADRGDTEAFKIGQNFLFDIGHVIGIEDAQNFHTKMNLVDPIEKLSAGPVHFAYSGWAFVDILPESTPTPDDNFYLKYNHPYSFEADAWIKSGDKSEHPVCIMNAAYSSGWCEQSFGISLTAVEITCKARGDKNCTFVMAPPHKIHEHLSDFSARSPIVEEQEHDVPFFFSRKEREELLKRSLEEKEVLLKEVHHRVKNNLQIISSLLNLQNNQSGGQTMEQLHTASRTRIKTMALVHEKLYRSANLSAIDLHEYTMGVMELLTESYDPETAIPVIIKVDFDTEISLHIDHAISVGLILNEIISNSYKYAFEGVKKPSIELNFKLVGELVKIRIADNGNGMPESIVFPNENSLGLELIDSLVRQLDGTIQLNREVGTEYLLELKIG